MVFEPTVHRKDRIRAKKSWSGVWKRLCAVKSLLYKNNRGILCQTEIRYKSLIQNSTDIIRILDGEGRVVFFMIAPSSEKILGYPAGYTLR